MNMNATSKPLSAGVQSVLQRARDMAADGKNTNAEVAALVSEIGKLGDADRAQLFDTFETVKQHAGDTKKEALEIVLNAFHGKPAQMLDRLEKDDGVVDLKDALALLAELGKAGHITKSTRVSVFTMMLASKATPEAKAALSSFGASRSIDIDATIRPLLARGNVTADEVRALKVGAGDDAYGAYQLSYWAMVSDAKKFAPGAFEALQAAAEETYRHVPVHYREDLELNRGRPCTPRGAHVLDLFSRETLQLNVRVSFDHDHYTAHVNGAVERFTRPDELGARLIELALQKSGHGIDSVRWDPKDGGRYVLSAAGAEQRHIYHTEILREFGYRV